MIISEENYLAHYGTLHKSGRYPWGSGSDPHQGEMTLLDYVAQMYKEGMTQDEIAKGTGLTIREIKQQGLTRTDVQAKKSIAKNEQKQSDIRQANKLVATGMSNMAIGREMNKNESQIRALRAPATKLKADKLMSTSNMLKDHVDRKGYVDVGSGVEYHLNISRGSVDKALAVLKAKGYVVETVQIDQLGTGGNKKTSTKVLAKPGSDYRDIAMNKDKIESIMEFSDDSGLSWSGIKTPLSVDQSRIKVRYASEGGGDADGVIYVRRGLEDLSLGESNYAQVRVAVDGKHYLKGMAMYKDNMPKGVDLVFNTVKDDTGNKLDSMKKMKTNKDGTIDSANPFGAVVRQRKGMVDGVEVVTSAMNIVNDEGKWSEWSKSLSSQMLSKQSPELAKEQLAKTYAQKKIDLDEISALTNPAVRKKLLEAYSDGADSSAIHLKAAAMPRMASHVILPVNELSENEVYAPNFDSGDQVVLIRFPHGGIFEIPSLTVNNNHPAAKKLLGNAPDAIGINAKVAERLSGADFDGDTVLVIPNNTGKIKTAPALAALKDFNPREKYKAYDGMPEMSPQTKGFEMGNISNLITDMTVQKASTAELARAVQHSMVVIDAEKHNLDYKQSAVDNGIKSLKIKYQGKADAGASTLISRAKSRADPYKYKPRPAIDGGPIDKKTGKLVFVPTNEGYDRTTVNKKTGVETTKHITLTQRSKKMAETDDARTLMSGPTHQGTKIEVIYAEHANRMKDLANVARLEMVHIKNTKVQPSAKIAYAPEVASLDSKLADALRNSPLERHAQVLANATISAKKASNADMEKSELKKIKYLALETARTRVGANKPNIEITPREWQAIQAGAIATSKLEKILNNTNLDEIKKLATPRETPTMTASKMSKARAMIANGHTQAEIANALGISVSTLSNGLNGEG